MISVALSDPMRALLSAPGAPVVKPMAHGPGALYLSADDGRALLAFFERVASDAVRGSITPREKQSAKHAAKRCADALARYEEKRRRIPVSITADEMAALRAILEDPTTFVPAETRGRLERRELMVDSALLPSLTARGRAVVAGTPPGDLVPFAFFSELGAEPRVRIAIDVELPDGETIHTGTELVVLDAVKGRLVLGTEDGEIVLDAAHPKIVTVLSRYT